MMNPVTETPVTELLHHSAILIIGPQTLEGLECLTSKVDGCWIWRPSNLAQLTPGSPQVLPDDVKEALQKIGRFEFNPADVMSEETPPPEQPPSMEEDLKTIVTTIADAAKTSSTSRRRTIQKKAARAARYRRQKTKTDLIKNLLLRTKGCTTAEVLKATGWPSVSMPYQAKAVGLKLRKDKVGNISRYFGKPQK